jgi:hypothetical protein
VLLQSFASHPSGTVVPPKIITTSGTLTSPGQLMALQKDQFALQRSGETPASPNDDESYADKTPTNKLPPNWWLEPEQSLLRLLTKPFLR